MLMSPSTQWLNEESFIYWAFNVLQEIERLKNEKPTWERRMRWDGMRAVFGGSPSLLWCNPFTGLRLRRLLLSTHGRRSGSEFSIWGAGRRGSPTLEHLWSRIPFCISSLKGARMDLRSERRCSQCGWWRGTVGPQLTITGSLYPHMLMETQDLWAVQVF